MFAFKKLSQKFFGLVFVTLTIVSTHHLSAMEAALDEASLAPKEVATELEIQKFRSDFDRSIQNPNNFVKSLQKLKSTWGLEVLKGVLETCYQGNPLLICYGNAWDWTALHAAVVRRDTDIVKLLLEIAGDLAPKLICIQQSERGYTAFHYAVERDLKDIVQILLESVGDRVQELIGLRAWRADGNLGGPTALALAPSREVYAEVAGLVQAALSRS